MDTIESVVTLISNNAFPIAACVVLWFTYKKQGETNNETVKRITETVSKQTETMEKQNTILEELKARLL